MQNSVEMKLRRAMARLADKEVEKVSVSSLCEKAGISRASFYVHYKDIDDLSAKTREYVINKIDEQLNVIFEAIESGSEEKSRIVFTEDDLSLLKGYTGKHVYWDFAVGANEILTPRYRKKMIEHFGEEYYNKNKEKFEFILNGGVASLYIDLLYLDRETYKRNMHRIVEIAREILSM